MSQHFCPNCGQQKQDFGACPNCGYVESPTTVENPINGTQNENGTPEQNQQPQGYPNQPYYPGQQPPQGYPNGQYYPQPPQGYPNGQYYPQPPQGYPNQPPYPAQPQQKQSFGSKQISVKKLLMIGIPVIAVILIVVLLFTVILPAINTKKEEVPQDDGKVDDGVLHIGDTWEVEDQWTLTIRGVYEITDRYREYDANKNITNPAAVYVIDYDFKNINFDDGDEEGMRITPDATCCTDSRGDDAYLYTLLSIMGNYDKAKPGKSVHSIEIVAVEHKGDLTCTLTKTTDSEHGEVEHTAVYELDADAEPATDAATLKYQILDNAVQLKIGEKWTVDNQWALTINSIKKTDKRSKYSDLSYDVAEVYVIEYTYTNINYNGSSSGLYMFFSSYAIDSAGIQCENYYLEDYESPEFIGVGETVHCYDEIAVSKKGGFTVDAYQYTDDEHGFDRYDYGFSYGY